MDLTLQIQNEIKYYLKPQEYAAVICHSETYYAQYGYKNPIPKGYQTDKGMKVSSISCCYIERKQFRCDIEIVRNVEGEKNIKGREHQNILPYYKMSHSLFRTYHDDLQIGYFVNGTVHFLIQYTLCQISMYHVSMKAFLRGQ